MRILVDAHVFDGKFQGTRTYLEGLYKNMILHKDVDLYFVAKDIEHIKYVFGIQANVHYVPLRSKSKIYRLAIEFPQIIKKYNIDYAHFQYIAPFIKNCRQIVTIHDLIFMEFPQFFSPLYKLKNGFLFRISARRADILLTVSEWSRRSIEKFFKIPSNKISIIRNCVSLTNDVNANIRQKLDIDKYIMSVSRIEPRKNHVMLLKAFVNLSLYRSYHLVLVGVYDLKSREFDEYYNSLNSEIKGKVIICSLSNSELIDLYRHASLFVFPSFAEGFGIPPLEAIVEGCPVLCSNATAMKEFMLPDNFSFYPYNLEELEKKMLMILREKPNMSNLRDQILKEYKWEIEADKLYRLIKDHCAK